MAKVIGLAVFALALSVTICTNIALRQHYKHSNLPEFPANATALTQLTGVVAVAVAGPTPQLKKPVSGHHPSACSGVKALRKHKRR